MKRLKSNLQNRAKGSQLNGKVKVSANKQAKILTSKGYNLKRISKGSGSVMVANDIAMKLYSDIEQKEGLYVWRQINSAIYKTLDNHPTYRLKAIHPYSYKRELKINDHITYIDIRHCYLQVANKLGYISDYDYRIILMSYNKTKIQVCAAITSLYRECKCEYYDKKGRVYRTIKCENSYLENAHHNIINYSRSVMYDFTQKGYDYYYRNVDGLVVSKSLSAELESHIKSTGLIYKEISGIYIGNGLVYKDNGELIDCI